MMWLLSTDRAELHCFRDFNNIPDGGYAILSHVWGPDEQNFQTIRRIQQECVHRPPGPDGRRPIPRDLVSEKIRQSCIIAERAGYKWIWNDTCCINKESPPEIDESIRSMFNYYSTAKECYAFLVDVSSHMSRPSTVAEFRASRWHQRGWTLQELIAPGSVEFLSREWLPLGSKHTLAPLLESITRVPISVLENSENRHRLSVAQRLSWASGRQTTRVEDRAHSLFGIFGLEMHALYGQGERAFQRYQEKLMKRSTDTTLLCWGFRLPWSTFCQALSADRHHHAHNHIDSHILSPFPEHFQHAAGLHYTPQLGVSMRQNHYPGSHLAHSARPSVPSWTVTPSAVLTRILLFETPSFSVALLCCADAEGYIGLILTPCSQSRDVLYHTGWTFESNNGRFVTARMVTLGRDLGQLRFNGHPVTFLWKEVNIALRCPEIPHLFERLKYETVPSPFHLTPAALDVLVQRQWELYSDGNLNHWNQPGRSVDFLLQRPRSDGTFSFLAVGRCGHHRSTANSAHGVSIQHWATFWISRTSPEKSPPPPHNCHRHHICEWPNLSKAFAGFLEGDELPVVVSFAPSRHHPNLNAMTLSAVKITRRYPSVLPWLLDRPGA